MEDTKKVEVKEKEEGIHAGNIMFTLITEVFNMCGMCWKMEEMEEVEETKMEKGKKEDNMENNDRDPNDCQHDWLRMMDYSFWDHQETVLQNIEENKNYHHLK